MASLPPLQQISADRCRFAELCASYRVRRLYLFGSALTDRFDQVRSDVDVFVEDIDPAAPRRGVALKELWRALEAFFGRRVDLITERSLGNPYFAEELEGKRALLYDSRGLG